MGDQSGSKIYTFAYFRVRDKKLHPVKTPEFSILRFLNENIENTSGGACARTYEHVSTYKRNNTGTMEFTLEN